MGFSDTILISKFGGNSKVVFCWNKKEKKEERKKSQKKQSEAIIRHLLVNSSGYCQE